MKKEKTYFNFGYLINIRKLRGYTQAQMAEQLGVARTTYADYEKGRIQPSLKIVQKVSELYNVSIEELITNKDSTRNVEISHIRPRTNWLLGNSGQTTVIMRKLDEINSLLDESSIYEEDAELLKSIIVFYKKKYTAAIIG